MENTINNNDLELKSTVLKVGGKSGKAPYIPDDDLNLVLASISGPFEARNKAIILISHYMGLRAKEIAALKIGDVYDLQKNTIRETIRLLAAYTKGNKFREVFLLDQNTRSILLDYINSREGITKDDALFLSRKNCQFSANTMQRMIGNLYKYAGVKGSSHSGRRSFATRLIRKNVDIYSIQQLMGHSSINTTQEYFSSNPDLLKSQVLKLSQ